MRYRQTDWRQTDDRQTTHRAQDSTLTVGQKSGGNEDWQTVMVRPLRAGGFAMQFRLTTPGGGYSSLVFLAPPGECVCRLSFVAPHHSRPTTRTFACLPPWAFLLLNRINDERQNKRMTSQSLVGLLGGLQRGTEACLICVFLDHTRVRV